MGVFDAIVGQEALIDQLRGVLRGGSTPGSWLFMGPPGSGRSVAARCLAASMQCPTPHPDGEGCGQCDTCQLVMSGNHPDVESVQTDGMTLDIARVRELVGLGQRLPSTGKRRIILMEDADRMADRTWNVLLKAIEEPPPHTVWMLCAPGPADVLPTVRSRCHQVRLAVPPAETVATYLAARHNIDHAEALTAAKAAQSHIGVANALLGSDTMRARRRKVIDVVLSATSPGAGLRAAATLQDLAAEYADEMTDQETATKTAAAKRALGVEEGKPVPPAIRGQLKRLDEEAKRRATRAQADAMDRLLTDLQSVLRDVLVVQLGADVDAVNVEHMDRVRAYAHSGTAESSIIKLDAISTARRRVTGSVMLNRLLALEAMMMVLSEAKPSRAARR